MDTSLLRTDIEKDLKEHLKLIVPNHIISKGYDYAIFPAGKLFRPLLIRTLAVDFNSDSENHKFLASFVELHHDYTLVHDDLPCMDNDDYRRGRLSTHKKFGEWQALLIGDGLINASYHLLSKIDSPNLGLILKFISWSLGPKGLIHGQVLDLSSNTKESFEKILQTHALKTGKLIQVCLISSYLLSEKPNYRTCLDLGKLGLNLGLVFQLLDDFDDIKEIENNCSNQHEININPFIHYPEESKNKLITSFNKMIKLLDQYNLNNLKIVIDQYLEKATKDLPAEISSHLRAVR